MSRRMASPGYQPRMSKERFNKLRPRHLQVQLTEATTNISKAIGLISKIRGVEDVKMTLSKHEIRTFPGDPNRLARLLSVGLERNHEILKHDDRKVYGFDTRLTLKNIDELSCVEQAVCLLYWYPQYTSEPPPKMRPKASDVVLTFERFPDDPPWMSLSSREEGLKGWCTRWEVKKKSQENRVVCKFWFSDQATMDLAFEVWNLRPEDYQNYPDLEEDFEGCSEHARAC